MMYRLIGLAGAAGAGKSSVAAFLHRHDYARAAFADELKRVARDSFGWNGLKDERGRRLLQVLGTEAGRAYDPDLWVRCLFAGRSGVDAVLAGTTMWRFVIDDVRYPNEVEAIRSRGGLLVFVMNGPCVAAAHSSEHLAATLAAMPDDAARLAAGFLTLHNTGTLADLEQAAAGLLELEMPG